MQSVGSMLFMIIHAYVSWHSWTRRSDRQMLALALRLEPVYIPLEAHSTAVGIHQMQGLGTRTWESHKR